MTQFVPTKKARRSKTLTRIRASLLGYLGYFLITEYTQVHEYLDLICWIVLGAVGVLYFIRSAGDRGQKSEEKTATYKAGLIRDHLPAMVHAGLKCYFQVGFGSQDAAPFHGWVMSLLSKHFFAN